MKTLKILSKEMRKDIVNFKQKFRRTYGVSLRVCINTATQPSITAIHNAIRKEFYRYFSKVKYSRDILTKTRKREVVEFKHMFMYIADLYYYGTSDISYYLRCNHATVYHGTIVVAEQISINNKIFINVTGNVLKSLNNQYNGKALCKDRRGGVNLGPILHPDMLPEEDNTKVNKFTPEQEDAFAERIAGYQ